MKPAISVILLTTLIGAGQGLFLAFYSAEWFVLLGILRPPLNDYSGHAAALSVLWWHHFSTWDILNAPGVPRQCGAAPGYRAKSSLCH
jgi:hypothetical protein